MPQKAFLIFSHELTRDQEKDLRDNWNVQQIISMPEELENLWRNVPPHLTELREFLTPIFQWIERAGTRGDLALIQGDFGATYLLVNEAFRIGLIPVYSTTRRIIEEEILPSGEVRQNRIFKHEIFRVYGI